MEKTQAPKMDYRFLGATGLKVSSISFGNWLNSDDPNNQDKITGLVKKAWDLGINFFDTAEVYGSGEAERQFGVALKALNAKREELVISTKIFWGPTKGTNPNDVGLSRKHIIEGINNSLKRLQLDFVDIVFCHRFDNFTPLEETCRAYDWLIRNGKTHYWGTSEWSASNIFEAFMVCEKYNLVKPVADQCQYNLFARDKMEVEYTRLFDLYGYGTTVWSPLAGGVLTGKYNNGIPQDSRLEIFKDLSFIKSKKDQFFSPENKETYVKTFQSFADLAKELGGTQAQLAMAWVLKYNNVSTAITGASKPEQIDDIVGAVELQKKLTPEVLEKIEQIFNTRPDAGMCARGGKNGNTMAKIQPRR